MCKRELVSERYLATYILKQTVGVPLRKTPTEAAARSPCFWGTRLDTSVIRLRKNAIKMGFGMLVNLRRGMSPEMGMYSLPPAHDLIRSTSEYRNPPCLQRLPPPPFAALS